MEILSQEEIHNSKFWVVLGTKGAVEKFAGWIILTDADVFTYNNSLEWFAFDFMKSNGVVLLTRNAGLLNMFADDFAKEYFIYWNSELDGYTKFFNKYNTKKLKSMGPGEVVSD